ncbi:MAG: hypothetical protein JXR58_13500 [Bacteroidales bacterium]|nr:hypothetical protein [Bacteroidales bacterium]
MSRIITSSLGDSIEFLGDISIPFDQIFGSCNIYNFLQHESPTGHLKYIRFNAFSSEQSKWEIPGTGVFVLINPTVLEGMTVTYIQRWKILEYIPDFKPNTIAETGLAYLHALMDILGIDEEFILQAIVETFYLPEFDPNDPTIESIDPIDYIETFVNDINDAFASTDFYVNITDFSNIDFLDLFDAIIFAETSGTKFADVVKYFIEDSKEKLGQILRKLADRINTKSLLSLLLPDFSITIENASVGLEFPRSVLTPVDPATGEIINNPNVKSVMSFEVGSFGFSTIFGLDFPDQEFEVLLTPSIITKGGFSLYVENIKIDLSRKDNIPEAIQDGRPVDFVGVFAERITLGLPEKWFKQESGATLGIYGEKVIIGTGGFSGIFGLKALGGINPPPSGSELVFNLNGTNDPQKGFQLKFNKFFVKIERNSILESEILGKFVLPGNLLGGSSSPVEIDIIAHFYEDGDFSITASTDTGYSAVITDVLEIKMHEIEIGREEGEVYLETKAELKILDSTISQYIPDPIQIKRLRIWDDGRIEFSGGGSIVLPEPKSLKIGPAEISVTALHIGSHEQFHGGQMRKYAYIGFDGGLNINPGGVDARGDGIKFYFTIDNDPPTKPLHFFIRIESIAIDLIIPGSATPETAAVLLSGYLSMKEPSGSNPDQGQEYTGGVSISLPKANIAGSAAMSMNPKIPSFLIDLSLELPVPITLGPTGLGIYGFRGLLGQRYVASKEEIGAYNWWDYYKKKVSPSYREGIQPEKFAQENGFSVGAGASISTVEPSGKKKAFTSKIFFMLSLPEVLLIQGQAAIVKERIGLDTTSDPPFSAMLAIDSSSITTAFGVNYRIPEENGKILQLDALLEMGFFYHDADAWYINVGTKTNPVQGKIFKDIFNINAYSYLQLYSGGIDAGAGISFYKKAKAGPLKAELSAYIDVYGKINFVPVQIGAGLSLGGSASLTIWGFGLTLSAAASIAAEIPKPFVVSGSVKACIRVLKKDRCIKFGFTWIIDGTVNTDEILLHQIGAGALARNVMSNETFSIYSTSNTTGSAPSATSIPISCVIPVDSKIDIEFLKPVDTSDTSNFGNLTTLFEKNTEQVPKKKGKLEPVKHTFSVEEVSIFYHNGSAWQPYNVFEAIRPEDTNIIVTPPSLPNYGYWQLDSAGKVNKLSVLARSPLEWLRNGSSVPDLGLFNINTQSAIFCPNETVNPICINFDNYPNNQVPVNVISNHDGMWFRLVGAEGPVSPISNPFGLNNALVLSPDNYLEIYFSEPVALTKLRLLTKTPTVKVSYYRRVETGSFDINNIAIYSYNLVISLVIPLSGLIFPIEYEDQNNPIDKIIIEPDNTCNIDCLDFETEMSAYVTDAIQELVNQQTILADEIADHEYYCANSTDPFFAGQSCVLASMKEQQIIEIQTLIDLLNDYSSSSMSCFLLQENGDKILLESGTESILLEEQTCCEGVYPCGAYVFSVCWQTLTEYAVPDISEWNETYETVTAMIQAMSQTVEPIWRPNGTYLIKIKTKDAVTVNETPQGISPEYNYPRYYYYGFHTKGPLGHFHQYDARPVDNNGYVALEAAGKEDEYKLSKLKNYIDVKRSYPNADGNIVDAKPLFYREPKIRMLFKYPYVYTMFSNLADYGGMSTVQTSLDITIKDPQEPDLIPYAETQWSVTEAPITGVDVEVLNNFMENGQNCVQATEFEQLNIGMYADILNLKPSKLYSAIFNVKYNNHTLEPESVEVHRYNFQTSRYACFREQVLSYLEIEEEMNLCEEVDLSIVTIIKEAVYDIQKVYDPADISEAISIINDSSTNDTLVQSFSHIFDRLIDGALKIEAMNTAETTEFNVLWYNDGGSTATERIIGILIRNPEPFNNPKISDSELEQSINVVDNFGNEVSGFKVIISKDRSKALITNNAMDIAGTELNIRFRYIEYDESSGSYELLDSLNEVITNIQIVTPLTQLCSTDCGSIEVNVRDVLAADTVPYAYGYEFLIEENISGFSASYVRENTDAKLPLYEVVGLKFNSQYSIKVRPLISGRKTSFGNACTIETKALTFTIINPADSYVGHPREVQIKVLDSLGNTITNYNENVSLITSGSATGAGLVDIVNGIGRIEINNNIAEIVTLSLSDTENTGINLGPNQDIEFHAIVASKLVILDPLDAEQGSTVTVTIEARNVAGLLDNSYIGTISLITDSLSAVIENAGVVEIINGVGITNVTNAEAEIITLALSDPGGTIGLDITSTQSLEFTVQNASKFIIIDPLDAPEDTYVTVTIQAQNDFGDIDPSFNLNVTLVASGTGNVIIENGGLVNIQNGVGTIQIFSSVPQTVTLSLEDSEGTGLNVDSVEYVVFVMVEGIAFKDNFIESSGTTLENHSPDIGDSWTKIIQINSGTLKVETTNDTLVVGTGGNSTGVLYTANVGVEYTNSDYIAEIKQIQGGVANFVNYLALRIQSNGDMYLVKFNKNSSSLLKYFGGIWTEIISGSGTSNGAIVKFEVMGNKLRFYENYENDILFYIDDDIFNPGKAGIGMGDIGQGGNMLMQEFDSFIVRWGGDLKRIFLDKFTNSGLLENNIPEKGDSWTQVINVGMSEGIKIQNGVARKTSNGQKVGRGSFYIANNSMDYTSENYEVEFSVLSGHNSLNTLSLGVRVQNSGQDGYFVRFNNSQSRIYKRITGVWTILGTVDGAGVSNGSIVRLRIVDSQIDFESNGEILLSETDSEITGVGNGGFGIGAIMEENDVEKHQEIDDFVVRNL